MLFFDSKGFKKIINQEMKAFLTLLIIYKFDNIVSSVLNLNCFKVLTNLTFLVWFLGYFTSFK